MDSKAKKTEITFHSGVLTIGGTVIEIKYEHDRIFFDFGTEFRPELKLQDDSLNTLLKHTLIPELDIYDEALQVGTQVENTAVFLSHLHLDHTRMLNYLDERIPVYALQETKMLLELMNANNDFILPAFNKSYITHPIIGLADGSIVECGKITVKLMRVDHDAYGACGMIITTPDLTIAYTGDLRLHGFDRQATEAFCKEAYQCDVLIMEGVSISFDHGDSSGQDVATRFKSEQELVAAIANILEYYPHRQITFNGYEGNVLRFAEIAKLKRRSVVLEAKMARILKECLNMEVLYYQLDDKDWGLDPKNRIEYQTLYQDEGTYLWQITDFNEHLKADGLYLHCDASPVGAFDPAYQIYRDRFTAHEIEFKHLASSGHAHPEDLELIVAMIQPKLLVPIHSLRPELLTNPYGERHLPVRGETLQWK